MTRVDTWHHGIVAQYWAEFIHDGPEIDYFRELVARTGQPALDVACGTGRLLLPCLRAGLDVDGCDVSEDMLAHCRARAEREGLSPRLYAQALHELDLPRRYASVFVCGGFGLGGDRARDIQALTRLRQQLVPGGTLALDHHLPYSNAAEWNRWAPEQRGVLPEAWPPPGEPRLTSDGSGLTLRSRLVDIDPLEQVVTMQMRAQRWRQGRLEAEEEWTLKVVQYFRHELGMLLERAGFRNIRGRAAYGDEPPSRDSQVLVFLAERGD